MHLELIENTIILFSNGFNLRHPITVWAKIFNWIIKYCKENELAISEVRFIGKDKVAMQGLWKHVGFVERDGVDHYYFKLALNEIIKESAGWITLSK